MQDLARTAGARALRSDASMCPAGGGAGQAAEAQGIQGGAWREADGGRRHDGGMADASAAGVGVKIARGQ